MVERVAGSGTYVRDAQEASRKGLIFGLIIPDLGATEIFEPICQGIANAPAAAGHALLWPHVSGGTEPIVSNCQALQLCEQCVERRRVRRFLCTDRDDAPRKAAKINLTGGGSPQESRHPDGVPGSPPGRNDRAQPLRPGQHRQSASGIPGHGTFGPMRRPQHRLPGVPRAGFLRGWPDRGIPAGARPKRSCVASCRSSGTAGKSCEVRCFRLFQRPHRRTPDAGLAREGRQDSARRSHRGD